jgi:ABC-type uncharacterized transport system substrate-binding protein
MRRLAAGMAVALVMAGVLATTVTAGPRLEFGTKPRTNGMHKWRIAYYEGGPEDNYYNYLAATVAGLMDLGWLERREVPYQREKDTKALWTWLATRLRSDFVTFLPDGFYSANWDDQRRGAVRGAILDRLTRVKNVDLIIAAGTWAGKDLAVDTHTTPTLVISTTDPIGTGIIKGAEDSGFDHVWARVDPHRYTRQLKVFHDIIGFRRLGVAYENSVYGRSYAVIDTIEKLAKERGFDIVRCHTKSDISDGAEAGASVKKCFEQLAESADAIYVTQQRGVNRDTIPFLVQVAHQHAVPTFSQFGSREVQAGFLLSMSRPSFKPVGVFLAATMAQVMNGAKPGRLKQVFEEAPTIAINLKTAEVIGLYVYADLLAAANEIYRDIVPLK